MVLPAFTGVDAVRGGEGLGNPRGFILIDRHQRNPAWPNVYSLGVCVAIPPVETPPVPTGAPKTGFMIESMVTAVGRNIQAEMAGNAAAGQGPWNRTKGRPVGKERVSKGVTGGGPTKQKK